MPLCLPSRRICVTIQKTSISIFFVYWMLIVTVCKYSCLLNSLTAKFKDHNMISYKGWFQAIYLFQTSNIYNRKYTHIYYKNLLLPIWLLVRNVYCFGVWIHLLCNHIYFVVIGNRSIGPLVFINVHPAGYITVPGPGWQAVGVKCRVKWLEGGGLTKIIHVSSQSD